MRGGGPALVAVKRMTSTIWSLTGPATLRRRAQSPCISRVRRAWYSPGAPVAVAVTGRTLCASGIDGMSAPMLTSAWSSGAPVRALLSLKVQS